VPRSFVWGGCSADDPNDPASHVLRVHGRGTGAGVITSAGTSPAVSCSIAQGSPLGTCVLAYAKGTAVPVAATPNAGSSFGGWSGACSGSSQYIVDMSGEQSVTATFTGAAVEPFVPTVVLSGQGSGTVSSAVGEIGCTLVFGSPSGQCSDAFVPGTRVTLTASTAGGSRFGGWGGACSPSGMSATCVVPMVQPQSVTASFTPAAASTLGIPER